MPPNNVNRLTYKLDFLPNMLTSCEIVRLKTVFTGGN